MNKRLQCISPIDQSTYVERTLADDKNIGVVFGKAKKAAKKWRAMPLHERAEICAKAIELFVGLRHEVAEEITWQMGRPIKYAGSEVDGFAERARHMIAIADEALTVPEISAKSGYQRFILREPLGVCFVIAPWNYPYLTAVNSVVPALMSGNSVVLKHSAQTPLCAERMVAAFTEAGLPEGVFQYLHIDHQQVANIISKADIDFVAFTGSVAGGKAIEQAAVGRFLHVCLELGGNDPAYIRADADMQHAVSAVVDGAFFNSGQSCCAIERAYVHVDVYDAFVSEAVTMVNAYVLDRPDHEQTTLGPMVSTAAACQVRKQTNAAVAAGAVAHIDVDAFAMNDDDTAYLAPQLLTQVDHSMSIMRQETFGPVLAVMPVTSDQQAIELMNDSRYGLTASVFTQDNQVAQDIGEQIETGTFFQNRCDYLDPALAWTGVKDSGRGCSLSVLGYASVSRPKSYHLKQQ